MKQIINNHFLPFITFIYSFVMLLAGLFSPTPYVIALVGFFLGMGTFYLYFATVKKQTKWLDVYPFVISLLGSSIASLLLIAACQIVSISVCARNFLRAQIFGIFAFPLIIIIFLWVAERLPTLIKKR